jgi:tRNA/tmRNA/rRNA uracil-C5-methylase (TrmA/RlmC/RlmD family)
MFHRGQEVELQITDYAFGGRGIAKIYSEEGQFIVFVDNTFPGQVVRAKIDVKRKKHAEAKLIEIINRSSQETQTQFQEISGGPYIQVPVEIQEEVKRIRGDNLNSTWTQTIQRELESYSSDSDAFLKKQDLFYMLKNVWKRFYV